MHRSRLIGTHIFFAGIAAAGLLGLATSGIAATGTIKDVQHVVILMQENRSFDHYYGCIGGVRGFGDRNPLLFNNGQSVFYQPYTTHGGPYVLPFPLTNQCVNDINHSQIYLLWDEDGGRWDDFVPGETSEAMSYFPPSYVPLHYALANNYTICDNYHCSLLGPTYPNRLYLFTGMIDPNGTGGGPATGNSVPPGGFTWTTYPELLQAAGVSWKVYRPNGDNFGDVLPWFAQYMNASPGEPLYDRGVAEVPDTVAALQSDVTNGTLPQVSWIIPTFAASEHPSYSPADGEMFTQNVLNALQSNPAIFNSTVLFVTYDEAGGFFDHVPSPIPPPGTTNEYVSGEPLGLGMRVPMLVISPWSRGGRVCSQVFDHTSVLRFLEDWTGVMETNISPWRRQVCGDMTSAFDFAHPNTNNYPTLPVVSSIETTPYTAIPPTNQAMPAQQTNTLLSMPLPYQAEIIPQVNCAQGQVNLTMTNSGSASIHFIIYANPVQASGPQQCDVAPGAALTTSVAATAGVYNLTCMGPNGFQRVYVGNLANDCSQIEVTSSVNTNSDTITLTQQNTSMAAVRYVVTDNYGLSGPWTNTVRPGQSATSVFAAAANNGWYDLTATCSSDDGFVRHFTGHIENGAISVSEPVLVPPSAVTMATSSGIASLMAAIPVTPATSSLPFYATTYNSNMVLLYPGWASNYIVQASSTLAPGSWSPVPVNVTNIGNYAAATMSCSNNAMFFRLRRPATSVP
jgi:phospholipase C